MISLLIPTRNNFESLVRCLKSFFNNSNNYDNFEVLLGMDTDDSTTVNQVKSFISDNNYHNVKIILTERMFYENFHKYMQNLYENSSGNILWLLADDVEVNSLKWDKIILDKFNNSHFFYGYVKVSGFENWKFSVIPIINRKWLEITGRISINPQTDLWLGHIADDLGIVTNINEVQTNVFRASDMSQHKSDLFYTQDKNEWLKDKEKIETFLRSDK